MTYIIESSGIIDLTVQLEIETMSEENFQEMRAKRKAILVAMSPKINPEKSIHSQKTNINDVKEKVEKTLRHLSKYTANASDGDNKFSEYNKKQRVKELRSVLITL